jgi:hypothetical protein
VGESTKRVPIARLLVEGVVIVSSILMAFAIDALWDTRQENARHDRLLEALAVDFTIAEERLESDLARADSLTERAAAFLMLRDEPVAPPIDSLRFLVLGLFSAIEFDVSLPFYDAAIGSGELQRIDSREFLEAAADYTQAARWAGRSQDNTGNSYFLGLVAPLRARIGSMGALTRSAAACPAISTVCPYPPSLELDSAEIMALLGQNDAYAAFEAMYNGNLNLVAGLRRMREAASRAVSALRTLQAAR